MVTQGESQFALELLDHGWRNGEPHQLELLYFGCIRLELLPSFKALDSKDDVDRYVRDKEFANNVSLLWAWEHFDMGVGFLNSGLFSDVELVGNVAPGPSRRALYEIMGQLVEKLRIVSTTFRQRFYKLEVFQVGLFFICAQPNFITFGIWSF